MALPLVGSISDLTDLEKTVFPFAPQLYDLPQQVFHSITDAQALKSLYWSTNPLISAFAFSLFLAPIFLLASEINRNYSQVDRCWSILPTVYIAHFVYYTHGMGLPTRGWMPCSLLASYGALTYNYWRKGGYKIGSEDYRWAILREHIPPPLFFVFNVVFISLAQSVLLFSISTPLYPMVLAARNSKGQLGLDDMAFTSAMVAFIALSFVADQQQWNFQNAKHNYQKTAKSPTEYKREDLDRGFNVVGLWALSRHPNFAAEQCIWLTLYAWSCFVTKTYWNWTGIGAIAYLCLFQASTWFTELVSSRKYPEYREYRKRVGKFIPYFTSKWPGDYRDDGRRIADKKR